VFPDHADLAGSIPFVIKGWFKNLTGFSLMWAETDITSRITSSNETSIAGIVPAHATAGRVEIKVVHNSITYQNISTYFTYHPIAVVTSCFPKLGPSRGGTKVAIKGHYFNDELTCVFDNYLKVVPTKNGDELICEMPSHHETDAYSLNLIAWFG
jgi:hypothetical protein